MMNDDVLRGLLAPADADGRILGVVVGVVTNNQDPEGMHRVKVHFPWLSSDEESHWARVATSMAGGGRGAYFLPEVDDEVLLAFEHGSPEHAYVIGSLWNGKDKAHENNADGGNNNRSIRSRSGHVIRFGDQSGSESVEIVDKTGSNRLVITSSDNKIVLQAQGDIEITSSTGRIKLSGVGIELQSQADVKIQAATTLDLSASAQASLQAALVKVNG